MDLSCAYNSFKKTKRMKKLLSARVKAEGVEHGESADHLGNKRKRQAHHSACVHIALYIKWGKVSGVVHV